jgi:predicted nucleic acid-binding Zn ribbon protein
MPRDELTAAEVRALNRLRFQFAPRNDIAVALAVLRRAEWMPPALLLRALARLRVQLEGEIAASRNEVCGGFNAFGPLPQATERFRRRQALRRPFGAHGSLWPSRQASSRPQSRPREARRSLLRSRRASTTRARSPEGGGSETPGGDEPPLDKPAPSRTCEVCGAPIERRRPQTRTCSSACRQKSYRVRLRAPAVTVSASETGLLRPRVTAELREALKSEVDRRRRIALVEEARRQAEIDAHLAEEAWA